MATARFRLEPVLRQRQAVEDQARRDLATVLRRRAALRDELGGMQQAISQSKRSMAGALVGTVDVDRIMGFARYSGQMAQRARELLAEAAGVERQIQVARQRLLETTRARRAIELLRQRQQDAWRRDVRRREQAEQDETAATRYARRADGEIDP